MPQNSACQINCHFHLTLISSAVDNVMDAKEDLYVKEEREQVKRIQSKDQGGTAFAQEQTCYNRKTTSSYFTSFNSGAGSLKCW